MNEHSILAAALAQHPIDRLHEPHIGVEIISARQEQPQCLVRFWLRRWSDGVAISVTIAMPIPIAAVAVPTAIAARPHLHTRPNDTDRVTIGRYFSWFIRL